MSLRCKRRHCGCVQDFSLSSHLSDFIASGSCPWLDGSSRCQRYQVLLILNSTPYSEGI